ncbi:unnamed protein product [Caenorhabditis auriculariae]|uniref:Amino acid transporter transmembrane domain-containing protein n=1 Tax=Caenorhabditis auriculariae TaxID=2777116 RepID=A0A8S1HRH7_9PELO|nr:unnamed protein product [Caenorhabditis auriculariae]
MPKRNTAVSPESVTPSYKTFSKDRSIDAPLGVYPMIVAPAGDDVKRDVVASDDVIRGVFKVDVKDDAARQRAVTIVRTKGISATSGLINFICGMIGPGCFSLAISFKEAGLWGGFILVFVIGFLSLISMHKIVNCSQYLAKINGDQSLDYGEMAEAALLNSYSAVRPHAKKAKMIVNACLLSFQLGVISVTLVFSTEHVMEVYEYAFGHPPPFPKKILILIFFVPQLLLNFIGHIKMLTVLSLFGNVVIFAAMSLIAKELLFHDWYPVTSLHSFSGIEGMSIAAGALIYSFEGQAMVLPLENSLKRSADMRGVTGVLTTSMNLVTILYAFLGFFGYVTFGDNVQGSLTLNLPNSVLSVSIKALLVAKMFFGSALQLFVIVQMLWPSVKARLPEDSKVAQKLGPYALRAGLMLISLVMAVLVPNLMDIIPLVGITSGMLLSLILPSFLDLMVFLPMYSKQQERRKFVQKLVFILASKPSLTIIGSVAVDHRSAEAGDLKIE